MKPNEGALELFLIAKEDCESCAGLAGLDIGHRVICFLAQQTVEKSFKAVLIQNNIVYPHIHDLVDLGGLLQKHAFSVPIAMDMLALLNPFAVEIRYGLPEIELPDTQKVLSLAQQTLRWCQDILNA